MCSLRAVSLKLCAPFAHAVSIMPCTHRVPEMHWALTPQKHWQNTEAGLKMFHPIHSSQHLLGTLLVGYPKKAGKLELFLKHSENGCESLTAKITM